MVRGDYVARGASAHSPGRSRWDWRDPEFDPTQHTFYYVRVIEIPTPSWLAYDAVRFGEEMPDYATMTVTNRAYTSPIWYAPQSK